MKNLEKGKFTVDDFLKQMEMINRLGSMGSLLKMIPGMGGMMKQVGDLGAAEDEMKKMKIIIQSMSKKERNDYKIIKDSHVKRIARGSGNPESAVRDFINKFKQMEKMMGGMMQMMKGGMPGMPGMGGGFPGMPGGGGPGLPGGNPFAGGKRRKTKKAAGAAAFFSAKCLKMPGNMYIPALTGGFALIKNLPLIYAVKIDLGETHGQN